ncbi:MAG: hypothetical protein EF806_00075 [Candidatus Methanoliparum thermophilum]|uniref:Uncharacterized protein n=1 Tax=Methanoliparum thermophilum TaxID=2491083 RepID=A0A520KU27_METT2|nr:hypothetical protein [Candidatus Methanoliparum sp. LAM-1]RZN65622.1 MAG: hypothetical protein EF806_00075 [Candidatus Methanoliparum thermophilum]
MKTVYAIILGALLGGVICLALLGFVGPDNPETDASGNGASSWMIVDAAPATAHEEINVKAGERFKIPDKIGGGGSDDLITFNGPIKLIGGGSVGIWPLKDYYYVLEAVEPGEAQVVIFEVHVDAWERSWSNTPADITTSVSITISTIYDIHITG